MRDPADTMTIEIPGVPPLPPKVPRITAAVRMAECGYTDPKDVHGCRNCKHRSDVLHNTGSWAEKVTLRCKLGDFPVRMSAVCNEWEAV